MVTGKVSKVASFGAFVQLADDIDGLVHISQISNDRVEKVKEVLKIGQEVSARVIKVDKTERRIGLSIKAADYTPEQLEREKENFEGDQARRGAQLHGSRLRPRRGGLPSRRKQKAEVVTDLDRSKARAGKPVRALSFSPHKSP